MAGQRVKSTGGRSSVIRCCRLALLPAASCALAGAAYAQFDHAVPWANATPASAEWECRLCDAASGWSLDLATGPALVFDDAFRFGDYSGADEDGGYWFGDILARYRGDDTAYGLIESYSRGRDAWGIFAEGGKRSRYQATFTLQSIPRRFYDQTLTPFLNVGSADLALPEDWVRGPTTGQMTALPATAVPVDLGYDRRILGLGLDFSLKQDFDFEVEFERQERQGVARSSGAILFSALEFAAPIDYATDNIEAALTYSQERWQASASYFGSTFSNDSLSVRWDNPYSAIGGADHGQQALVPDNEAHRLTLAGSALLPARTIVNGHLSVGRLSQDARLLPYTANATLAPGPPPTATADAEVETLSFNLRAASSPWARLSLEGEIRLNDFDNRTARREYDSVSTDVVASAAATRSTAYDYRRRQVELSAEYRLGAVARFEVGADSERFERNDQDRRRTTTDRVRLSVRIRPAGIAELYLNAFVEDRDGSSYEVIVDPSAPENPLMRKYNLANREREGVRVRASYFGAARADLGVEIEFSEDRYDDSPLGVTDTDYFRAGADFSYLVGESGMIYASVYGEQIETRQAGSQAFAGPDWAAATDDDFTTTTLGANWPGLFGRIDAELELGWSRAAGSIRSNTSGLAAAFPELRNRRRTVHLGLSYPLRARTRLGLDVFYEKLSSDDWMLDGVDLASVPSLLSLGAAAWNYDNGLVYLSVHHRLAP